MAVNKKQDPNEELVDYMAPLMGSATRKEVVVGVNGELIRIKRGVRVKIKKKFYRVLQQAADQELAAYRTMERAQEQGKRAAARL